jgi:hypothetical protein
MTPIYGSVPDLPAPFLISQASPAPKGHLQLPIAPYTYVPKEEGSAAVISSQGSSPGSSSSHRMGTDSVLLPHAAATYSLLFPQEYSPEREGLSSNYMS